MEQLEIILSLCGTILGLIIATLTFLKKFITNAKAKKIAEQVIEISDALIPYIEQAEEHIKYSGTEKKEFVLAKVNQFAVEHGIEFDRKLVEEKVDELVAFTKHVNTNTQALPIPEDKSDAICPDKIAKKIKEVANKKC